jgi:hypothetical protein
LQSGKQCIGCPTAETIPPANRYYIKTTESILSSTSLDEIKLLVTQAENHGGGWVPLVFHQVCNNCSPYSITKEKLKAFLSWLKTREINNTIVKTVNEVMTGDKPPPLGPNLVTNPSLELDQDGNSLADCWERVSWGNNTGVWTRSNDAHDGIIAERIQVTGYSRSDLTLLRTLDAGHAVSGCVSQINPNASYRFPDCWLLSGFGNNSYIWSRVSNVHSGNFAESLQVTNISSGDRKFITAQDSGSCAPAVTSGKRYALSAWYRATVPTGFVVYYRTNSGNWRYWQTSSKLSAADIWEHATYTTPVVPSRATHISFGLYLSREGVLITDDYAMTPMPGADKISK